jgi:hypothetical protein
MDSTNNNESGPSGTRKLAYCMVIGIIELVTAFVIVLKFGQQSKEIITMPYMWLNLAILGVYPFSNVITKVFSSKLESELKKWADRIK